MSKFNSKEYWETRYSGGGNSGAGSYGRLAKFKAKTINRFVKKNGVDSVLELGVGDGNQLSLSRYPKYFGADVSKNALKICREKFKNDRSKEFLEVGVDSLPKTDLAMSLDVIFHLIEDSVFEEHMNLLFDHARKYVIVYASNQKDNGDLPEHVKHRKFTDWVEKNKPDWQLIKVVQNKYPYKRERPDDTSFSDFYFFQKR